MVVLARRGVLEMCIVSSSVALVLVGCLDPADPDNARSPSDLVAGATAPSLGITAPYTGVGNCEESATRYTPYTAGDSPSGTVAELPWRGLGSSYPDGMEAFAGYGTLPVTVNCSDDRDERSYLQVTDGCLTAVAVDRYTRGQIGAASDDAFRMVALGYQTGNDAPIKWTDMGESYRFYYSGADGSDNFPGFKAFIRYRTEDDLYVASWRVDGVAQIQRKHCGLYEPLVMVMDYGAPSVNAWHTIEFTAVGDQLDAYFDGDHALSVIDDVFDWGTAGIRTDAMNGAYLDDWSVFAP